MRRVQVQLTDDQINALRNEATHSGQTITAIVREALDDWIVRTNREQRWERALTLVGAAHSGLGDLAENHDYYLGEDFEP
jgi:hypothetical protein